jgi:methylmalonyl-CoA mutase N-terminal domain/subunit
VSDPRTPSGIPVRACYTAADLPADLAERLGGPGEFPFTRGIHRTMYRGRLWTMRQYAGFGTAEETNARFRQLLDAGQTGLSTAFDLPTQMGYDADHPLAAGEVGRVGVAVSTVEDLRRLFEGIPLDRVSTSMTINATAAILLAMYLVTGEEQGVAWPALSGTIQNDVLKEYVARGTYVFPPEPTTTCSRRSPSSAPRGGCGPPCCTSASPSRPSAARFASTPRRGARRSPPSSRR